jgi:endonuclease/exonuclease/phosphatase family metal-dependent hydrolase
MLNFIETFIRRSRRHLSRSEWLIRLLRLTRTGGKACEPGLVLVQIDGLPRRQLERAMATGHMPFLTELLRRHRYHLHSLYSGLPSSTPAMTAELLYGVKCAVPAFSFYDRAARTLHRMFEPRSAREIDRRLKDQGQPLLTEGSAYAGVYTGGARETHFCASTMSLDHLFKLNYPMRLLLILLFGVYNWIRAGVLIAVEFFLALIDCVRGLIAGQDLWKEIKFIPSRVGVSILMREMATAGAKIDVARGLPVIYLDLIGYDEQSHRRGPTSQFAHWSLKGIDHAIARVWKAAQRSPQRDYDVWIFSDHGSEETLSYARENQRTLREAVSQAFDGAPRVFAAEHDDTGVRSRRMRHYMRGERAAGPRETPSSGVQQPQPTRREPIVAAMGPVAHVYVDSPLDDGEQADLAERLVDRARVPMVSVPHGDAQARVWTKEGRFVLPQDAATLFGPDHPFLEDLARDFVTLTRHPDAGDFVLWGWSRTGPLYTFPIENGSHAGPGLQETHAFALLPDDAPVDLGGKGYLRPLDLRNAALRHLRRNGGPIPLPAQVAAPVGVLRVMTYNVHSCVGIDGKLSPQRIARVIARYRPDIVALQEVDVGRRRTGQEDQAETIANCLNMNYHFHPTIQLAEEAYGDCVLSRLPMHVVKTGTLPTLPERDTLEPRGALWVAVELDGRAVQLVNTHLGLNARERRLQINALLGSDWLGDEAGPDPVILCGDFNASPVSSVCRLCARRFRDVQMEATDRSPRRTWFGHFPIARIDHIFIDRRMQVLRVDVGDDHLSRVASDHRPLFAELRLP